MDRRGAARNRNRTIEHGLSVWRGAEVFLSIEPEESQSAAPGNEFLLERFSGPE